MNKTIIIWIAIFAIMGGPLVSVPITIAYATSEDPYDSGYDHGCDDAGLSPSDMYINEPGKGPDSHTDEFMSGYRDGFQECGGVGHPESTPENTPLCNIHEVARISCELGDWVYRNSK